jgi:plasmid stabilization system protein ParE
MLYRVNVTDTAYAEIAQAYAWLAERSAGAAQRWQEAMFKVVNSLVSDPARYPLAPEADWCGGDVRQLLIGKRRSAYRVLFRIHGRTVRVLRVRHHAQDILKPGDLPQKPIVDDD